MKITQKEAVARLLAAHMGKWLYSYELVQKDVEGKFTGIEPMRRAYELVKDGFTSKKATYTFEARRVGRYTQFRCKERRVNPATFTDEQWEEVYQRL